MSTQPEGGVVLKRAMSRLDLTMAGLGAIIGSGWLFGGLYAANDAGPSAVIGWIIGGIAVALGAPRNKSVSVVDAVEFFN